MSYTLKFYSRLLIESLPAWASRVGVPDLLKELNDSLPPGLLSMPLDEAPSHSLMGIVLDYEQTPLELRGFYKHLETLMPGGLALLKLPARGWNRKELKRFFASSGLELKFFSYTRFFFYPAAFISRMINGNSGPAEFFLFRWLENLEYKFFPYLHFPLGTGIFAIASKPAVKAQEPSSKSLSIIIPVSDEGPEETDEILAHWAFFLKTYNLLDNSEIILVSDGQPLLFDAAKYNKLSSEGLISDIQHFRKFGQGRAVKTGIAFARGRVITIDESRGEIAPEEMFSMIAPLLKKKGKSGRDPVALVLGANSQKLQNTRFPSRLNPSFFERFRILFYKYQGGLNQMITGSTNPDACFRALRYRDARALLEKLERDDSHGRTEMLIRLRKEGLKTRTLPVNENEDVKHQASYQCDRNQSPWKTFFIKRGRFLKFSLLSLPAFLLHLATVLLVSASSLKTFFSETANSLVWYQNEFLHPFDLALTTTGQDLTLAGLYLCLGLIFYTGAGFLRYLLEARFVFKSQGSFFPRLLLAALRITLLFAAWKLMAYFISGPSQINIPIPADLYGITDSVLRAKSFGFQLKNYLQEAGVLAYAPLILCVGWVLDVTVINILEYQVVKRLFGKS